MRMTAVYGQWLGLEAHCSAAAASLPSVLPSACACWATSARCHSQLVMSSSDWSPSDLGGGGKIDSHISSSVSSEGLIMRHLARVEGARQLGDQLHRDRVC